MPRQPASAAARRRRARTLLALWGISLLLGVLQPCCELFAAVVVDTGMATHHDCDPRPAPGAAEPDGPASVLDCDPGTHIGSADGPPAEGSSSAEQRLLTAAAAVVVDAIAPGRAAAVVERSRDTVRGSPPYLLTGRLRL